MNRVSNNHIVFILLFFLTTLSCKNDFNNIQRKPGTTFMKSDMNIILAKNFLENDSEISKYLDLSGGDITSLEKIVIDRDSCNLYLLNNYGEILKVDCQGNPRITISKHGQGPGEMLQPIDVRVYQNRIYILDAGLNKICIYNTCGDFISEILFYEQLVKTFTLNNTGKIIFPTILQTPKPEDPLFSIYDENGILIKKISKQKYIDDDLLSAPVHPLIFSTPDSCLILALRIQGNFYKFDMLGNLVFKASIKSGPEYEQHTKENKIWDNEIGSGKMWHWILNDMTFTTDGKIFVFYGGTFKKKRSMAMIFNSEGYFIGRLFQSSVYPYPPMCFTLESDSIAWIYSQSEYKLSRCLIRTMTQEDK